MNEKASYRGVYDPKNPGAYKISRSKIELYLNCPRCFWLDRTKGVGRPSTPPFTLNSAVDKLLKAEFDTFRADGASHPLQQAFGINAVPAKHELIDQWRENFQGVQYFDAPTNLLVFGAIDDLWLNADGSYSVVDYKATAKGQVVTELADTPWHDAYRRQMEMYQWLLRKNGLTVSDTGYFVYCTGRPDGKGFDAKLEFDIHVIPYTGDDGWVYEAIEGAHECLQLTEPPLAKPDCEYCHYRDAAYQIEAA